jgi:protoporphyrinogen oxidase
MKIAIIGGGLTGLTAAYRLSQKGHEVSIFERSNDLGGLAGGFQIQGTNLEKTYHHIFRTDTDIIDFVKELGIEGHLTWNDSSVSIYYDGVVYPFMTPFDLLKFKPLSFVNRLRCGAVVFYLQKTKSWKKFTKVSAYDWMKKWGGEQVSKVIWEPLLKGKFADQYDKVAMAWLWARLHIRANSRQKGDSGEKLGYFTNGFNVITETIVKKLKEKNVQIFNGVNVQGIFTHNQVSKITLEDGKEYQFDKVIATVPSHIFANLVASNKTLQPSYFESLKSINYLGAICMIFSSDQDLSPYYWHNINDLSSPFLVFINHTKLIKKEVYSGRNIYYIGSYIPHDHKYFQMTDDELSKLWFDYLKKIFPKFSTENLEDKFIFRLKNAQHIVDLDYEAKIPAYKTPLDGVYLSNFSQIFPEDRGTNYAVREGNKIAELVLSDSENN